MSRLAAMEADTSPQAQALRAALEAILPGLPAFHQQYRNKPLRSSIGSDSTGQSCRSPGMGLVVRQTLPRAARAEAMASGQDLRKSLAVGVTVTPRMTLIPRESTNFWLDAAYRFARGCGPLRSLGYRSLRSFRCKEFFPTPDGDSNLVIMGGVQQGCGNNLLLDVRADERDPARSRLAVLEQPRQERRQDPGRVHPGLPDLLFQPGMVDAQILRGIHMVRHHRPAHHLPVGAGRRRVHAHPAVALERLRELGPDGRFAPVHRGSPCALLDYLVKTLLLDRGWASM